MSSVLYILAAILVFGMLVAVHELGHFLAAKACGVRVNEFSIGMGPEIWSKVRGETQYSLRALPIGGFCAMEGEDEESDDESNIVTIAETKITIEALYSYDLVELTLE